MGSIYGLRKTDCRDDVEMELPGLMTVVISAGTPTTGSLAAATVAAAAGLPELLCIYIRHLLKSLPRDMFSLQFFFSGLMCRTARLNSARGLSQSLRSSFAVAVESKCKQRAVSMQLSNVRRQA